MGSIYVICSRQCPNGDGIYTLLYALYKYSTSITNQPTNVLPAQRFWWPSYCSCHIGTVVLVPMSAVGTGSSPTVTQHVRPVSAYMTVTGVGGPKLHLRHLCMLGIRFDVVQSMLPVTVVPEFSYNMDPC